MSTLYRKPSRIGFVWDDFNGRRRYVWSRLLGDRPDEPLGHLGDWTAPPWDWINRDVTLAEAERSLRQLGHTIGEWDD